MSGDGWGDVGGEGAGDDEVGRGEKSFALTAVPGFLVCFVLMGWQNRRGFCPTL